ncbi:hypothetical protein ASD65_03565 [Microbacterium sp. Root61]|uniref:DUF4349 domain-containing protein n=1 Tax=Microbacterium sp. Root61 TaxID=1736570 RepID=UPI0006F1D8E2|nr:DUF4349 domain-containing protein [Microbacterium sp. Root61]KRA23606.1 hypothetical protein ASD65_03565 [Microbacterium sp. Root61]
MNTSDPRTPDAANPRLPELSDERIDVIENGVFAGIADDRVAGSKRRTRRRRVWTGVGAAAGVLIVAAVIAPTVLNVVSPMSTGGVAVAPFDSQVQQDSAGSAVSGAALPPTPESAGSDQLRSADIAAGDNREIIASASATVTVDDIPAAARQVGQAAIASGGYVESMSIGQSGMVVPMDGMVRDTTTLPYSPDGGWVTVRVPSDQLTPLVEQLADVGEVTASSINRQDVTDQAIDLRARIESAQTSVDRLTELMGQATTVADLIAAESALAERQATLESYQQQLEYLEAQVDMSSLSVSLQPTVTVVKADPAGFGDGLAAGWNGLVATLNGIVIALGFLIPWIVVALVVGVVVWGILTLVRRRRRPTPPARTEEPAEDVES